MRIERIKNFLRQRWKGVTVAILGFFILFNYLSLPNVKNLKFQNPTSTALIKLRNRQALAKGKILKRKQIWIPYSQISPYLRKAVIIAEDSKYYLHDGIDYNALWYAFNHDIASFSYKQGGSTITMQLAKNLYLSPDKTILRKVKEMIIATRLERKLTKSQILELYLNVIEWGDGVYGCEAASWVYFKKPCAKLSQKEAAILAASIPNPRYSNLALNPQMIENRTQLILSRLRNQESYYVVSPSSQSPKKN
jgi:monofunctional biosynthetic peptidoglycan transglycosylase